MGALASMIVRTSYANSTDILRASYGAARYKAARVRALTGADNARPSRKTWFIQGMKRVTRGDITGDDDASLPAGGTANRPPIRLQVVADALP